MYEYTYSKHQEGTLENIGLGSWCLMPLSTIFQARKYNTRNNNQICNKNNKTKFYK